MFFVTQFVISQNLVVTGDNSFYSDPFIDVSHHLDLKNVANYSITVECSKTIISTPNILPAWAGASYCFAGNCYSTTSVGPSSSAVLGAGQSFSYENNDLEAFSGYFTPGGVEGISVVEYCFSNQNDPTDKSCVTITYNISSSTNVDEVSQLSEFYPNPAKDFVNFNYKVDAESKLLILNILGEEVANIDLDNTGTKQINVSSLTKGVYFGYIISNNKLLDTKKIFIE